MLWQPKQRALLAEKDGAKQVSIGSPLHKLRQLEDRGKLQS